MPGALDAHRLRLPGVLALLAGALLLLSACSSGGTDPTSTSAPAVTEPTSPATTVTPRVETSPSPEPAAGTTRPTSTATAIPTATPEIGPDGFYTEVQVNNAGTKHIIPWQRVFSGGVAKDGIPSIDSPRFATSETWDDLEYRDTGFVIGVEVGGTRRAYPFQVLVWHEIVNDRINGKPILISYCPLCATAIAFERSLNGQEFEFGVSGLLYNSDLLMYDRNTGALWSQISGKAVAGDLTGARLAYYPSEIMSWADWKSTYPDSAVLTRETGHARDYDREPYVDYYFDDRLLFPVNSTSDLFDALRLKDVVTGVEVDGPAYGAFLNRHVYEAGLVNETVGDTPVVVFANPAAGDNIVVFDRRLDGIELTFSLDEGGLVDDQTGSRWSFDGVAVEGGLAGTRLDEIIPVQGYWFAWVAFHPETSVWSLPDE